MKYHKSLNLVVVIHVSFSNSNHKGKFLSDFKVSLSNPIGPEVLYALEKLQFRIFPWTLKAGIESIILNVNGSQNDCTETGKNASDFVLESTQHIVDNINLATNYQVCSSFKQTSSGKVNQTCCQMAKLSFATKFNYNCLKVNSVLFASDSLWVVIYTIMFYFAIFYLMRLLLVLVSRAEFDLKYPEYYKLEESLMSPSFILLFFCRHVLFFYSWDEKDREVSSFPFAALLTTLFGILWLVLLETQLKFLIIGIFIVAYFVWGLFVLFSTLCRPRITDPYTILNRIKVARSMVFQLFRFPHDRSLSSSANDGRGDYENVVKTMLSPFHLTFRNDEAKYRTYEPVLRILDDVLASFSPRLFSVLFPLFLFFRSVARFLFVLIAIVSSYPMLVLWNFILLVCRLEYRTNVCNGGLSYFHALGFFVLLLFSVQIIIFSIVSFLLGLFLNLIYFIPYFTFFSVLTFYCCTYWKTMEEKYFVLKRLIYDVCRETQDIDNGCIPNRHPEANEKVLPVVSKELYDKIRKVLLPYDINLFSFGLKMVWAIAFSLSIFALIRALYELNVADLVQVVTTASLGVMPHIFNTVALKTNEETKKANTENLELNVKFMMEKLIREGRELARTVLIIEQDSMRPFNPSFGQLLKNLFGCYHPDNDDSSFYELVSSVSQHTTADAENTTASAQRDSEGFSDNDDVEDIELTRTVTVRRNETTTDENFQNSENVHTRFESNPHNDDVEDDELTQIVVVHRNHKTTTDKHVENSENVHARFESIPHNDDVEDDELVLSVAAHDKNETASDGSVLNSGHARARSDFNSTDLSYLSITFSYFDICIKQIELHKKCSNEFLLRH